MRKEGWHAWTLFLGAALVLSNAAWFYSGRVELHDSRAREQQARLFQSLDGGGPSALKDNQRCING